MQDRQSFILYKSFYPPIENLSNEDLGILFRAIFLYQNNEVIPKLEPQVLMAFSFFKNQFALDEEKYKKVTERNKINGLKGGRPKTQANPKNPVGFKEPKKADNDTDNDNDNDNKVKERGKPLKKKTKAIFPDWIKPELWDGFIDMRKKNKKPPTDHAKQLIISQLEKFRIDGHDPNGILQTSIINGWSGVFKPKPEGNNHVQTNFRNHQDDTTNARSRKDQELDSAMQRAAIDLGLVDQQ